MRDLTPKERKAYERLRKAYRWAGYAVVKRKGAMEELQAACQRITAHAIKLGWLAVPRSAKLNG